MPTEKEKFSISKIGNLKLQIPATLLVVAVAAIVLVFTQTTATSPTQYVEAQGGTITVREPIASAFCGDLSGRVVKVVEAIIYSVNKKISDDNVAAEAAFTGGGPTPTPRPTFTNGQCHHITSTHLDDITTLDLSGKDLKILRAADLAGMPNLERLRLNDNTLRSLPNDVFTNSTSLEVLRIENNLLSSLDENIFDGLTSLDILNLSGNRLSSLHEDLFEDLTGLLTLGLGSNRLSSLPADIFDGISFSHASSTSLNISDNPFGSSGLPAAIFNDTTGLNNLTMENNGLTSLPTISNLTNLVNLDISSNDLESTDLTDLTSLDLYELDLSHNSLAGLPSGIFDNYENMDTLDLSHNSLAALAANLFPDDLEYTLVYLYLQGNALTGLPNTIFHFTEDESALEELDLADNALTSLPSDLFDYTAVLDDLDLSGNQLTTLPAGIFGGATDLGGLNLSGNPLTSGLPATVFNGLTILAELNLSETQLPSLPSNLFNGLSSLTTLSLHHNPSLTQPTAAYFNGQSLSALKSLALGTTDATTAQLNSYKANLPALELLGVQGACGSSPLDGRTQAVIDAIVTAVPGVTACADVTPTHLAAITTLDLSDSNIRELKGREDWVGDLYGLTGLTSLDLSGNTLTRLTYDVLGDNDQGVPRSSALFNDLESLRTLDLSNNRISSTHWDAGATGVFSGLRDLTSLDLSGNRLTVLHESNFDSLQELETLNLEGNRFASLDNPRAFATLTDLRTLTLKGNRGLSSLDTAGLFAAMSSLQTLNLEDMELTSLGEGIFNGLSSLRELNLNMNRLTSLPEDVFNGLSDLRILKIANNQLASLPENIFAGLSSLQRLDLYGNQLASLPAGIFAGLSMLQQLYIYSNQLASLPSNVFAGLTSLVTLHIHRNQLASLPANVFAGLTNLETLLVHFNPTIMNLNPQVFSGLNDLQTLRIDFSVADEHEQTIRGLLPARASLRLEGDPGDPPPDPVDPTDPVPPPDPEATATPVPDPDEQDRASPTPLPQGRILRIKPSVESISIRAGAKVRLSVNVFGLQNQQDDSLAEKEEVTFEWSSSGGEGSFDESAPAGVESNGEPDDRKVLHTVSDTPGTYTVTASLRRPIECRGTEEQCNAEVKIVVIRTVELAATATPVPCQISGTIPAAIPDSEGNQHSVFTPSEGGTFASEDADVTAPVGAVSGCEYIGIRVVAVGSAVNRNQPLYRYTLAGMLYSVQAVDSSGAAISEYQFNRPVQVCVPLPGTLRGNISEIDALKLNPDGTLTSLTSKILSTPNGSPRVCGNLSELPADIAAGKRGAPDPTPVPMPTATPEPPETGGSAVSYSWALLIAALGIGLLLLGAATLWRRGPRHDRRHQDIAERSMIYIK